MTDKIISIGDVVAVNEYRKGSLDNPEKARRIGVVLSISRSCFGGLDRGKQPGFRHAVEVMYSDGSVSLAPEGNVTVIASKEKQ